MKSALSYYGPHTRIRRQGSVARRNLERRLFLKGALPYVIIFFVFALAYVWTRVQVIETGYQLRQLEEIQDSLKEENHALLVETATLRSPQKLEKVAAQLSLKKPTEHQVFFIKGAGKME